MPELPEVETVRAGLERYVVGRTIATAQVLHPRAVRRDPAGPSGFAAAITGRRMLRAERRGKYLWLAVGDDEALLAHLGMSGQMLLGDQERPLSPHVRARFTFTDGGSDLRFTDQRTFGHLMLVPLCYPGGTTPLSTPRLRGATPLIPPRLGEPAQTAGPQAFPPTGLGTTSLPAAGPRGLPSAGLGATTGASDCPPTGLGTTSLPAAGSTASAPAGLGATPLLAEVPGASAPTGPGATSLPAATGESFEPRATSRLLPVPIAHIAPDPLEAAFDPDDFSVRLRRRRTGIKRALLDQSLISGIGNIYADEALWRARLHWARPTETMKPAEVTRLLAAILDVLTAALKAGGTSFDSLYVNVNGESGYFERSLEAYGRAGQPCSRCGSPITRDSFMNRSSFSCPRCQPRPRRAHW